MAITINGNGTIGGVSVGGLPNGVVDTDMIAAGAVTAAKRGSGAILQVVQATKTDTASVTGGTFADVGLSASITPSSSSNKILVLVQANIGGSLGYSRKGRLMRNSTAIHIGDSGGNRPQATAEENGSYAGNADYNSGQVIMNFLDSPSTTSATTYKVQYASYGSNLVYINRSGRDLDGGAGGGYDARTASSILLMEVAA
jgi:hypothetical protein